MKQFSFLQKTLLSSRPFLKVTGIILACIFDYYVSSAQQGVQVTVTDKAVTPNDMGDDSKAIQEVLNNVKPGTIVFFPAGLYLIDAPMDVTVNNITLKGEDSTVFRFTNKVDYWAKYGLRTGVLNIIANDITIDRLFIDQNFRASGRPKGEEPLIGGIFIGGAYKGKPTTTKNITVQNCTIYDYYGDGICVFHSISNNFKAINNTLISAFIVGNWDQLPFNGEQGISVATGDNIYIANNKIRGAIDDAIATHARCNNVTVINNDITTIRGRLLVCGITNGLIKNNTIEYIRNGWAGILITFEEKAKKISMNDQVIIEDNKIHINKGVRVLAGIMLYGPGTNIIVRNNIIESEDQQPAGVQLAERKYKVTQAFHFGDNITIENNDIKNFKSGIKFNITDKVKQPIVTLNNNKTAGMEKDVTRETTPYSVRPQNNQ